MNQLPIEGQYKVYIIEDFEKLTVQGENSILKFLEEPPDNTIAILFINETGTNIRHYTFKMSACIF